MTSAPSSASRRLTAAADEPAGAGHRDRSAARADRSCRPSAEPISTASMRRPRRRRSPAPRCARRSAPAPPPASPPPSLVPLLRRRLRIPAPVTVAACVSGPLALSPCSAALEEARRRPLRAADVGRSRWSTSSPTTTRSACARACGPAIRSSLDRALGRGSAAERPPAEGAWPRLGPGDRLDRALSWVHWLWFLEPYVALLFDPDPPQRPLPALPPASSPPSSTSAARSTSSRPPRRPGGPPSRA